ncbi:TY-Chap2 family putative peptide chaperone [Curtobacterium oceanosedimentum]|uniref:TY-Chap2 family putative peptide chaperone n=1 Tax=Curtobacterium oceanosedimentum TaxID=465820 RepID=UPI003F498785
MRPTEAGTHPGRTSLLCPGIQLSREGALWQPGAEPIVQLNRNGTLHAGASNETVATWTDAVTANGPHDLVKLLEEASGHEMHGQAPPTTPRTLAYRFISGVLTALVNSRYEWDARNEFVDSSGDDAELQGYLRGFPAAVETAK